MRNMSIRRSRLFLFTNIGGPKIDSQTGEHTSVTKLDVVVRATSKRAAVKMLSAATMWGIKHRDISVVKDASTGEDQAACFNIFDRDIYVAEARFNLGRIVRRDGVPVLLSSRPFFFYSNAGYHYGNATANSSYGATNKMLGREWTR